MELKHIKYTGILSFIGLFSISCDYNVEEELVENPCEEDISFSTTVSPIIDNNCIQCHNGSVHSLDFRELNIVQDHAMDIKKLTGNGSMPLDGSLTSEEIADIACWVDNGAQDN